MPTYSPARSHEKKKAHDHHDHDESVESVNAFMQYAAALGNLAIGTVGAVYGNTHTTSVFGNALHDGGDSVSYFLQGLNVRKSGTLSQRAKLVNKSVSHSIISAGSAWSGYHSVQGFAQSMAGEAAPTQAHPMAIAASAASLTLAGALVATSERRIRRRVRQAGETRRTSAERDWTNHLVVADVPSSGVATFGALIQSSSTVAEQVAGMASAALGVWMFRPTPYNIAHDHAAHQPGPDGQAAGHGHGHGHQHVAEPRKMPELIADGGRWLWAKAVAASMPRPPETGAARYERSTLEKGLIVGTVVLAGAGVVWAAQKYGFMGLGGAGQNAAPPIDLPPAPMPMPTPQPAPLPPVEAVPLAGRQVEHGEGWYQTMAELGLPSQDRAESLTEAGPALSHLHYADGTAVAYWHDAPGVAHDEWRMGLPQDGLLTDEAVTVLRQAS